MLDREQIEAPQFAHANAEEGRTRAAPHPDPLGQRSAAPLPALSPFSLAFAMTAAAIESIGRLQQRSPRRRQEDAEEA